MSDKPIQDFKSGSRRKLSCRAAAFHPSIVSAFARADATWMPRKYVAMLQMVALEDASKFSTACELMCSWPGTAIWFPDKTLVHLKQHFLPDAPLEPVHARMPSPSAKKEILRMHTSSASSPNVMAKPSFTSFTNARNILVIALQYPSSVCCRSSVRQHASVSQHVSKKTTGKSGKPTYHNADLRARSGDNGFPGTASSQ